MSRLRSLLLLPAKRESERETEQFKIKSTFANSTNQWCEWIQHQYTHSGLYVFNPPLQCSQLLVESGQAGSTRHVCRWHKGFNANTMTVRTTVAFEIHTRLTIWPSQVSVCVWIRFCCSRITRSWMALDRVAFEIAVSHHTKQPHRYVDLYFALFLIGNLRWQTK